jgi:hypothetical protein
MSENAPESTETPTASPGGEQPVGTKVETTVTDVDSGDSGDSGQDDAGKGDGDSPSE